MFCNISLTFYEGPWRCIFRSHAMALCIGVGTFGVIYVQEIDEADYLASLQSLDPRPVSSER